MNISLFSSILRHGFRKPRIAVIGHSAATYLDGAERSLISIVAAIDRDRYDVCAVIPAHNVEYMQAIGRHTDAIEVFPYSWWSGTRPSDAETVARFVKLFRRRSIDLVHVNTVTLMDPLHAARQVDIPCIVHARELVDQDDHLARLLALEPAEIVARIRATADFIIANSEATHRLYCVERRSFRLYNCIDIDAFDMANEVKPGLLKIGIISSNHPKKGIEAFVRLAILAAPRRPDLEFIVIGPHTAHTEELSKGLQRDKAPVNLRFAGYLADSVEAVRQLNVVASFSVAAESFGRTLVEAMAARRPVIAYNRGAAPELVRHGCEGFIIPPLDIERALAYIETLADDPKRIAAMGEAGRARASELFAPSVFASELNEIYRHILEIASAARA